MDVGTDLTDEELAALPKGRHMLGIVGTYGIEGYVPAQPAQGEEARLVSYHPDGDTCTLNINGVEMYYDRVDRNTQPAPSMADVDYLVDTLSKFADHHVEHGRMSFDKWTLRSAVEAMLAAAPEAKP